MNKCVKCDREIITGFEEDYLQQLREMFGENGVDVEVAVWELLDDEAVLDDEQRRKSVAEARALFQRARRKYCTLECLGAAIRETRAAERAAKRRARIIADNEKIAGPLMQITRVTELLEGAGRFIDAQQQRVKLLHLQSEYEELLKEWQQFLPRAEAGLCLVCGEKIESRRVDALYCTGCEGAGRDYVRKVRRVGDELEALVRELLPVTPISPVVSVTCDECGYVSHGAVTP